VNKANNPYMDDNYVHYNKLGITDAFELRLLEYDLALRRMGEILEQNALGHPGSYDLKHLQAIHQHLFQDVYAWAGKPRTIPLAKMLDKGTVSVFANPEDIEPKWRELAQKTHAFATAGGLTFKQKVDALVDIFVDANHIHPFPEGNGRSLQVFMCQLAREQGVALDYGKTNDREWNRASAVSGVHGEVVEDGPGDKRLKQYPRDRGLIAGVFENMARPERISEQAAGVVNRTLDLIRRVAAATRHAKR